MEKATLCQTSATRVQPPILNTPDDTYLRAPILCVRRGFFKSKERKLCRLHRKTAKAIAPLLCGTPILQTNQHV